jgi:formate dehydrogenase subunit gamma
MGSRELTKYAEKILDVNMHQTSKDMKLTLEPVYCLGNCALSPAIMIDEKVYGKVDEEKLNDLVENL